MGNNYCKQLGIKPQQKISQDDFVSIWRKYNSTGLDSDNLTYKQARKFLKHFAEALGEPKLYTKSTANHLIDDCDRDCSGFINLEQFKQLFFEAVNVFGSNNLITTSLHMRLTSKKSTLWTSDSIHVTTEPEIICHPSTSQLYNSSLPVNPGKSLRSLNSSQASFISDTDDYSVSFLEPALEKSVCPFERITKEQISLQISHVLNEISKVIERDIDQVALLLPLFKWNKDSLFSKYFDDMDKYLKDAGLYTGVKQPLLQEDEDIDCNICYDTVSATDAFALECGHYYCKNCWKQQIKSYIESYGVQIMSHCRCLAPKCNVLMTRSQVKAIADKREQDKYEYFFTKAFIEGNSDYLTFCPNGCGNAILYKEGRYGKPNDVVECICGKKFCFGCGHEYHNPISCDQLKLWSKLDEEDKDSATMKLITAISKPCPKCGISVDRTDGCNHITCRQCNNEWCWQCRGSWSTHGGETGGYYMCNEYEKSEGYKKDQEADKYLDEHNRYLHYYSGYFLNNKAEEATKTLMSTFEAKLEEYKIHTGAEPHFILDSLTDLVEFRHILKYTYIYGFFLPTEQQNVKNMFQLQQALAQNICEQLGFELMRPISQYNRLNIVKHHQAGKKYFANLVDFFENEEDVQLFNNDDKAKTEDLNQPKQQIARWICPRCTYGNIREVTECFNCKLIKQDA